VQVRDRDGRLVAIIDLAYEGLRLAIELDGWLAHAGREQFQRDRTRQNRLVVEHGWTVLRYTAADVRDRPDQVVAQLAGYLRQHGLVA
jgi:very-short-patch-repair endonuclease